VLTDAPVYLGFERGYFAEEGLDVEAIRIQAAGDTIPLLATGQLDVASGGAAAALYNAVARGADVRMVLDVGSTLPGFPLYSLAVRKDLVDSGQVRDWSDLKGLRFANVGNGNGLHRGIDEALRKGGGSMADVEITLLSPVDMLAAFGNRAIDAAPLFEPFAAQGEEQGLLVRWRRSDDIIPRLASRSTSSRTSPTSSARRWRSASSRRRARYWPPRSTTRRRSPGSPSSPCRAWRTGAR
jgi:NitT/TauT family transport system substrate-binding protein